ncbi:MAG: bifunctional pyr operon transcriptional regulator/uracil phosphoribosyltransferase PyrR [Oscillospiraceae bacterium]|nr:bifunctional pyr operon transcriptional regulator/uracil phosphoribosyltransferase PyrR [Oscillospiraceae bacterium]
MKQKTVIMDENAMKRAVTRIAYEILEQNKGAESLCIVGVLSRGVYLAKRIAEKIYELEGTGAEFGELDITPHRDDIKKASTLDRTQIDFDINDKVVVLVDDVIYTGRSIRAAIDALIARGRPKRIQLAVLIDRGHREVPIRPDYVGKNLPTSHEEKVKVMVKEMDSCDSVSIFIPD